MEMSGPASGIEDEQAAADAPREKTRDSIFLTAIVVFDGTSNPQTVHVRNVSAGGMMIDVGVAREKGLGVTVALKNIGEIRGRVVWSTASRIGIAFDQEINPHLARHKPVVAEIPGYNPPLEKSRRPGLAVR